MKPVVVASLALALSACGNSGEPAAEASPSPAASAAPATSAETAATPAADLRAEPASPAEENALINRIWVRDTGAGDLPGAMLVFLDDGTLIQDSCWETYRLSKWTKSSDGAVSWNEDGMDITADVVSVDNDDLTLRLNLTGGAEEQKFEAGEAPFVCPDMPR